MFNTTDQLDLAFLRQHGFRIAAHCCWSLALSYDCTLVARHSFDEGWTLSVYNPSRTNDWKADQIILSMNPTREDVLALLVMSKRKCNETTPN